MELLVRQVAEAPLVPDEVVDGVVVVGVGPPLLEAEVVDAADARAALESVGELGDRLDDVDRLRDVQEQALRYASDPATRKKNPNPLISHGKSPLFL